MDNAVLAQGVPACGVESAALGTARACDEKCSTKGLSCDRRPPLAETGTSLLQVTRDTHLSKSSRQHVVRLPLVPYPAHVQLDDDDATAVFVLRATTEVSLGEGVSVSGLPVRILRGLLAKDTKTVHRGAAGSIRLELSPNISHPEGYALHVQRDGVLLQAQGYAGLLYGVQTLQQLVALTDSGVLQLPAVTIEDKPRFGWRGLHLDVSRHFFTAEHVKKLLDVMASLKLNHFHWHLTDDQGWRLPVPVLPELTRKGAISEGGAEEAYTEEEIRDVVAFAKERNIDILPEVDVPGHAAAAIVAYPELGNTDVVSFEAPEHPIWQPGVHEYTLAPSDRVLAFLETVFQHVTELFPGQFVHTGGDEAPTGQWSESRKAQSVLLSGTTNVQSFFNKKVTEMLRKWNRTTVGWDEIQHMGGLSTEAVIMAWRSINEARLAVQTGHHVVVSDQESLYFDHYQGPQSREPRAICCNTMLEEVYGYDPMPRGLSAAQQKLVLGAQGQLWSEYFPTWNQVEYMAFPRSLALAERAWTPPEQIVGFSEFRTRLVPRLHDLEERGVAFRRLDGQ